MRVIASALKGRRLTTPRGRTTRPTSDQVRIACLDTLMPFLPAGPFLDLFAGAGGVGIEALSRGAPSATFVEQEAMALRALRENVESLGLAERARVVRDDAVGAVERFGEAGERFAVAFLDPPYESPRPADPRAPGERLSCGGGGGAGVRRSRRGPALSRARCLEDALRADHVDFFRRPRKLSRLLHHF